MGIRIGPALADRRGFLVAYPQGLALPIDRGITGWDASGPRDPYAHGIDDGLFVSNVLNAIQAGYCVDPARIAATGISNGGSMVGYLACVLSDRIAAFAPVEGEFFQIPGGCHRGISDIAAGPDGSMWLSEQDGLVARISSDGNVRELALPSPGSNPDGITAGPGRTIWIAETGADAIVKVTLP